MWLGPLVIKKKCYLGKELVPPSIQSHRCKIQFSLLKPVLIRVTKCLLLLQPLKFGGFGTISLYNSWGSWMTQQDNFNKTCWTWPTPEHLEQNKAWSMPMCWTSDQDLQTFHFLHMIEFKPQSLDFFSPFILSLRFHWHQGLGSNLETQAMWFSASWLNQNSLRNLFSAVFLSALQNPWFSICFQEALSSD